MSGAGGPGGRAVSGAGGSGGRAVSGAGGSGGRAVSGAGGSGGPAVSGAGGTGGPAVSAAAAGYSGTPLPRKLGIKTETRLGLLGAPGAIDATLGELPPGVRVRRRLGGEPFDVIVSFHTRHMELARRLPTLAAAIAPAGGLWIAWPKRASGVATDVTEDVVRALGLAAGLVDNKVCAIDAVWSGLRLVYRLRDRPGRGAGSPGP